MGSNQTGELQWMERAFICMPRPYLVSIEYWIPGSVGPYSVVASSTQDASVIVSVGYPTRPDCWFIDNLEHGDSESEFAGDARRRGVSVLTTDMVASKE